MDGNEGIRSCITLATSMSWSQLDWTGTRQNGGNEAFALQLLYICYDCFASVFVCGFLIFTHFFVLRCFLSSRPLYMLFLFLGYFFERSDGKWVHYECVKTANGMKMVLYYAWMVDTPFLFFYPFFPFSFHCLPVTKIRRKQ